MRITHLSAECYPAAKVGGLADVTGSLPKYLNELGEQCEVVIPKYHNHWILGQQFETVFENSISMGGESLNFSVQKLTGKNPGFPFYVIDIPGKTDRPGIYIDPWSGHGYWDEFERFLAFQIAALEWIKARKNKPDIIHCHDHHTGLVPFMLSQCNRFRQLAHIPTVFTVHNAEYHGQRHRDSFKLLPAFNIQNIGLLDWHGQLNPLAAGLKCAWQITTVSENYMKELMENSNGLEALFKSEKQKATGILNGIDTEVWNPETDTFLQHNYTSRNRKSGKWKNKEELCRQFGLNPELPLISFIGRLVREKGADLLPDLFEALMRAEEKVNFIVLGTGDPQLHQIFERMKNDHVGYFDATLQYNEGLAHQMYAGSDFILMPSRVEPCGLNQMFAMRYGTIPIVRGVGGLKDTVRDISKPGGAGIVFSEFTLENAIHAVKRAIKLYENEAAFTRISSRIMKLDYSWNRSAEKYRDLYYHLTKTQAL